MVASAHAAHLARRARDFGVHGAVRSRSKCRAVKARKDAIVRKSRTGVEKWLRGTANCTVLTGQARVRMATNTVRVGDDLLEAPQHLHQCGRTRHWCRRCRASIPCRSSPAPRILDLDELPRHLVVVGGGYVGLEFAQMFRRFGSEVTVIDKNPRLALHEDEDASDVVREIFASEGIHIRLNATCIHLEKRDDGTGVGLECDEGAPHIVGSHVLLAIGRTSQHRRPEPGRGGSGDGCARIHRGGRPTADHRRPASGRWATATGAAPSRTLRTTTTRSSRTTC